MLDITKKSLPDTIKVRGEDFLIKTDFRTWIRFSMEFKQWIRNGMQENLDIKYLFKDHIPIFEKQSEYDDIMNFAFPKNVVPHSGRSSGEDVLYYQYDGDYIYSAFMQAYGIDLMEQDMHWHKFLALMNGLPDNTKLSQIMGYRAYTGEKVKNEAQIYRKLKDMWMPPYEETEEEKQAEEEFNSYFG